MSSGIAVGLLTALAIGELIADKHPKMPDRTAPPGLIARFVSGGFSGAVICSAAGYDILTGIIVGGIGSLAGAFAGFEIRRLLTRDLSLPNLLVALTEDAVAIALGLFFVDPRF
jgi:uncharacterized membrane protein